MTISQEAIEAAHAEINKSWRNDRWEWDAPKHAAERALCAALPFLSTLPIAGEGKELTEFQAGQWWLEELEKHWGTGETTPQTRRAAKVALSFAEAYFGPSSPGKDGGQEVEAENLALRKIISDAASALPNGAFIHPEASVGFMEGLPKEIALVCSRTQPASTALVERLGLAWAAVGHHEGIEISVHADAADTWNALCAILDPLARTALSASLSTSKEGER